MLPKIVFITTYPPQECGIATFSQDLVQALNKQFNRSFDLRIALLEREDSTDQYPEEVTYSLNPADPASYKALARSLNHNPQVEMVVVQHEFGFYHNNEQHFLNFLDQVKKPVLLVFHTVLPNPEEGFRQRVNALVEKCDGMIVMTENARELLTTHYTAKAEKITVIPHGTHLVHPVAKSELKEKYGFSGRKILSTFGLISSGKNIETTLRALPAIVEKHPDVLFLAIGKTHPSVVKQEGETYREMLIQMTKELGIEHNVRFINKYLSLPDLLEYLQLTDTYLFTSKDPNQAVSGTFSYALSCGCPIISTPMPHALEVLKDDLGIIVPFSDHEELAKSVDRLLSDEELRNAITSNCLHRMAPTSWQNVALSYARLFRQHSKSYLALEYRLPEINLHHFHAMTTNLGMIQFSKLNEPDIESGFTLDDNARALIALCQHFKLTGDVSNLNYISKYLSFIEFCLQPQGYFLNYVDEKKTFTDQNFATNLSDSNGRAVWALGYLISLGDLVPENLILRAEKTLKKAMQKLSGMHSTRAMAFAIKGLCYYHPKDATSDSRALITLLSGRLVQMYRHESSADWQWFESYLTYANSLLPEALLCAYEVTHDVACLDIAKTSFDFLLSYTFHDYGIKVISNRSWMLKGEIPDHYGEQPIDVAYTVLALDRFYTVCGDDEYLVKLETAFNWFLGQNHLNALIYNPCTGGCWDGLEENHVNLNQGAESTVSYLMARLTIERHREALLRISESESRQEKAVQLHTIEKAEQRKNELSREIIDLTTKMEAYPELYRTLTEKPLFISSGEDEVSIANFEHYLDFLKLQLKIYNETQATVKVS